MNANKIFNQIFGIITIISIFIVGMTVIAYSEVNLNINIGPPPRVFSTRADTVLIPKFGVYFVPDKNYDLFFLDGYWWSPRGDNWYRSRQSNGTWEHVSLKNVPRPIYNIPRNYHNIYGKTHKRNEGRGRHD